MPDRPTKRPVSPSARAGVADAKAGMRRELRRRRRALAPGQQATAALAVAATLATLPAWRDAAAIALYLPADGEIGTEAIATRARQAGIALYLPVVNELGDMHFAAWREGDTLQPNRYGIPEPPADAPRAATAAVDIICLPLVGWDTHGGRLGMGGGYYDRLLSGVEGPLKVGLAHACQRVGAVPREHWDIKLDYVATDDGLHDCRNRESLAPD
jgi:5-formyltetrahydrofolate cyclo-ligase